ncbi:MAG: beta-lactamase family protein [Armatimonadetes bacterium]|nr:beta-lactamase family protein [Armatimonadota bacterium]
MVLSLVSLTACLAKSGIADTREANLLAEKVVALVNSNEVDQLSKLALPEFFETIPHGVFPRLVAQVHGLGLLGKPVLSLDLGEERTYKVVAKSEGKPDFVLGLTLGAESKSRFFSLKISPWESANAPLTKLGSDNPLRTAIDRDVEASVQDYLSKFHPVGLTIGLIWKGKTSVWNYGQSRPGKAPTANTVYEIGSITKTMTGYLLAKAVGDKRVSLDQDIRTLLPDKYDNLEFQGKPISFRDLATHSSGLPANPPGIPDDAGAEAYDRYTSEGLLSELATIRLTAKPGSRFSYSNMGGGLCGLLLARSYHRSFESLLIEQLWSPLAMKHTGIALTTEMEGQYATPHDAKGEETDRWNVHGIEGAGAVRSTMNDLLKYAIFNMKDSNPIVTMSHQVLNGDLYPKLGYFWLVGNSRLGGPYVHHEGGTGGFTANVRVFTKRKMAVVVLMNSGDQRADEIANSIALRVLYHPKR